MNCALLLAAGKGSRINDVTNGEIPKCMLKVGNTTLIRHTLAELRNAGIKKIIVVVGYKADILKAHIDEFWGGGVEYVLNQNFETTNVLYSFSLALPYLGKEDFIYLHADTIFSSNILKALLAHNTTNSILLAIDRHDCEEEEMKVIVNNDGRVLNISKEIDPKVAHGEFLGLARIPNAVIKDLKRSTDKIINNNEFSAFFESALQHLIDHNIVPVETCDVTGALWREVDFPCDYEFVINSFER